MQVVGGAVGFDTLVALQAVMGGFAADRASVFSVLGASTSALVRGAGLTS